MATNETAAWLGPPLLAATLTVSATILLWIAKEWRSDREKRKFIPHITDQRHKEVYKSQINLIHHAGDDYIADIVTFYGVMDRIGTEIQGVYLPSYKTISPDGRASIIDDIVEFAFECAAIGQSILVEMERTYPSYRLKRRNRKAPEKQSDADLQRRMDDLRSDLDRARSTHSVNPP